MGSIRVVLVDDEPLIRAGLRMILNIQPDIEVIGEAGNGAQAIEVAHELQPDIVLMDVRMPGMDGVTATERLLSETVDHPDHLVKVVILTTFNEDDAVYAALRAGASGFLLKGSQPEELVRALRAVASGDAWLDPPVARRLLADFKGRPDSHIPPPATMDQLTSRERDVLVLIAHGLTNADIAQHLILGTTTVKTHVGRIFMKLGLHDRAQAVATAYQCGLVHPGEHPPPRGG